MAPPRELNRVQVLQSTNRHGALQYTLLSATGVSIALSPRAPSEVAEVMAALGHMVLDDQGDVLVRSVAAVRRLQRFARSVRLHTQGMA
jgi:hypothetical protein